MYKILGDNSKKIGTLWAQLENNFLELCRAIIKIANPDLNLKGYADNANEPANPEENDCYLVIADGTVWAVEVVVDEIITWDGADWQKEDYKITELNTMLQTLYFSAFNISYTPGTGMSSTNVQDAIDELAAIVNGG